MSKYINAETLIDMLNAKADMALGTPKAVFGNVIKMIDLLPPADVVKVKHGYWCDKYKSGVVVKQGVVSSCCDMWNEHRTKYCPYCGAILDEERKENND